MQSLINVNLLEDIRRENLSVYRSSPQRLREDVGQEAQIAQDYIGRLIYELLQNADDAMESVDGDARICFQLTSDALWVANSGRSLNDADVRGLCGISASSKRASGQKRASIGHKGMGFKSVLEISEAPEVYSLTASFRFSPQDALNAVRPLIEEGKVEPIKRAPVCRFPWAIKEDSNGWNRLRERGFRTAFRFPLRSKDRDDQQIRLRQALKSLPVSSLLFLRRLQSVEIDLIDIEAQSMRWNVERQRLVAGALYTTDGLSESGVYSIKLSDGVKSDYLFTVAYDAEISIGSNRGTLNEFAWENVEITEAAVAARIVEGKAGALPSDWRRLHVFLPSGEPCPYDLLISGAFNSNLSRQEIKIGPTGDDYNRHLLRNVARLFRDELLPALIQTGTPAVDALALLYRRIDPVKASTSGAAFAVYEAFRDALTDFPFIPTESGALIPMPKCVVPPIVADTDVGEAFRAVLPSDASHGGGEFPTSPFCGGQLAAIIVDHGAYELTPLEAALQLADPDPIRSRLQEHSSGGIYVDPVLSVLEGLWHGLGPGPRENLVEAVRKLPLFPTAELGGNVHRIVTQHLQCFYPPRSLKGEVALSGLCFLLQELCWGALSPSERNQQLAGQMPTWVTLFELHEFKFPDVMRASVLPALDLESGSTDARRANLHSLEALAEICQLAGRMPDSARPLPYQRLGPNRALFNLSRLDVPCRSTASGEVKWVPAYRAYLGEDWIGEASFEVVCNVIGSRGKPPPEIDFLVGPKTFSGLLDRFQHLERATVEEIEDLGADEVRLDEDEESALDIDQEGRWSNFFRWLGVNQAMRAVHFHDVEDRASGWLKTGFLRKPEGWAFSAIPADKWKQFIDVIFPEVTEGLEQHPEATPYFYRLHDLEHIVPLLDIAANDISAAVGRALYEHFAQNWSTLEPFAVLDIALVPGEPHRRAKPPSAKHEEIIGLEQSNFWMHRLRNAPVCPTGHGPRKPPEVWFPTQEVLRRFGRKSKDGLTCLLPTLSLHASLLKGRARGLLQAVGVREELSQASFSEADALVVLCRLREIFASSVLRGDDLRQELREVIRPAYRNVLELLSGRVSSSEALQNAPILAQDGLGNYAFKPSHEVFYVERRDTRDRLQANVPLWTFVLEAYPAGRTPLVQLLKCRVLEESLQWLPQIGERSLSGIDMTSWRSRLRELGPYILARVGADRADEIQTKRDAGKLRTLITSLEPVTDIRLGCQLDGFELPTKTVQREAFVYQDGDAGTMLAFVRWSDATWPPTADDADALATAFGEVLGAGYFESFLALIRAPSSAKRESLLKRAGAPTDIDERRDLLFEDDLTGDDLRPTDELELKDEPKSASPLNDAEAAAKLPSSGADGEQPKMTPLYSIDQISVDGTPIVLVGATNGLAMKKQPHTTGSDSEENGDDISGANGNGYGGHTDMDALNVLGMAIAMSYEVSRLRKSGQLDVRIFDTSLTEAQPNALVFNVSTPANISRCRSQCPAFDQMFSRLILEHGVSPEWPGFDVLTLNPNGSHEVDRLIELKSSGVSARIQEMSWNEWKSARHNQLRHRFYLYLVGNLRADLDGSCPFIRTIRDPFEQLFAEIQVNHRVDRKVQLAVHQFQQADHLDLAVKRK